MLALSLALSQTTRPLFSAPGLPHWTNAVRRLLAGQATVDPILATVGDSTEFGAFAGTDGTGKQGAFERSMPAKVAALLAARGIRTNTDAVFGMVPTGLADTDLYHDNLTVGAGWVVSSGQAPGGRYFNNSTTTNPVILTPTLAFDRVDLWWIGGVAGTLTLSVDGGSALATIDTSTGSGMQKTVVTIPGGSTAIEVRRTANSPFLAGIAPWKSDVRRVRLYNLGANSSTTAQWSAAGVSARLAATQALGAVAHIVSLGINDKAGAVTDATYKTNMQTIITGLATVGDVGLLSPLPSQGETYSGYRDKLVELKNENGLVYQDTTATLGTYESHPALYFDTQHGIAALYDLWAAVVRPLLAP